jgi:hypothetical protein
MITWEEKRKTIETRNMAVVQTDIENQQKVSLPRRIASKFISIDTSIY